MLARHCTTVDLLRVVRRRPERGGAGFDPDEAERMRDPFGQSERAWSWPPTGGILDA
jgi:hypothetical protein